MSRRTTRLSQADYSQTEKSHAEISQAFPKESLKRPCSSYQIFRTEKLKTLKETWPDMSGKARLAEVSRVWKNFSAKDKLAYVIKADTLKSQYLFEVRLLNSTAQQQDSPEHERFKRRPQSTIEERGRKRPKRS